jgi:hypothetical protein
MLVGVFLICLGVVFLLDNLGYLRGGILSFIIPLFLIALGASMILKRIGKKAS